MSINQILFIVIALFAVLGGIDYVTGNRLGLGKAFEEGLMTMGKLALCMAGIIVLAPVLAEYLAPIVVPVYRLLGADPAMFAGSLLACDMGGASMARELSQDPQAASLGGILTASMLGVTISFTLPVAMDLLQEGGRIYASKGMLCGIVTIPAGILAGGLAAGFSWKLIVSNLLPVLILAVLIALGLWKAQQFILRALTVFGRGISVLAMVGLLAAGLEQLIGVTLIAGMAPLEEAFVVIGEISVVLMGALPMLTVLNGWLSKPLNRLGKKLRVNSTSVAGLVASLANSIPTFGMLKDMDPRGKVINMAFAVSGAFVFGDHMAFTAGFDPDMVAALIVGKLVGGLSAVVLALLLLRRDDSYDK